MTLETDETNEPTTGLLDNAPRCRVTGCDKPASVTKYLDVRDEHGSNTGVLDAVALCRTPGEAKSHDRIKLDELRGRITDDVVPHTEPEPPEKTWAGEHRGSGLQVAAGQGIIDVAVEGVPKGHTFRALSVPDDVWAAAKEQAKSDERSLASIIVGFLREYGGSA